MDMKLDSSIFSKSIDLANSAAKIAANLTEKKADAPKPADPAKNDTNQPHTQTVEVKVGNPENQKPDPVIVHEKSETHVHNAYPEARSLTKEECEVEKLRIAAAQQNEREEREFRLEMEERARKERKERAERERDERYRREEKEQKSDRRFWIGMAIVGGVGLGLVGYSCYTDYRANRAAQLALPEPTRNISKVKPIKVIKAEGTVK